MGNIVLVDWDSFTEYFGLKLLLVFPSVSSSSPSSWSACLCMSVSWQQSAPPATLTELGPPLADLLTDTLRSRG